MEKVEVLVILFMHALSIIWTTFMFYIVVMLFVNAIKGRRARFNVPFTFINCIYMSLYFVSLYSWFV